ncbi:hypothetical protein [Rhodococcus sp. UNC363MFTsu5.1]|uniref:hypothetical protein n=1 Tax=Rhodococcus sp. UNC363MFTsu5.1 TaxID=1449069 RepID=UPI000AF765F4|nr:hypothetical protein [Rhodococcus sp. UNC363MFTsu5.1]
MSEFIDGHNKTVITVENGRLFIDGYRRGTRDPEEWLPAYRASHPVDDIREDIEDLTADPGTDDGAVDRAYDQLRDHHLINDQNFGSDHD